MPDANDMDLVQEYARRNSEAAFAELVRRHINMVYSVALRFVGNSHDAEDITQAVFIILAQKAASLGEGTIIIGWLYETTRFTAMKSLRGAARRRFREQEALMQSTLNESDSRDAWLQVAPLLEEAMTRLSKKERTLLALRFFEKKSGAETAAMLGIHESAAYKRTERAVEKLRLFFSRRGIKVSASGLLGAISANSIQPAPAALAKSVTVIAAAKGAAASGSTLTLIKGALKLMAWTKAKTAIVTGASILLVAGTTTTLVVHHATKLTPRPVPSGQTVFPRNIWQFSGYDNPESAALSTFWALGQNDARMFRNSMSPALQKSFAGKPDNAVIGEHDRADVAKITGYRILDKQVLSEDEVVLDCYAEGLNDSQRFLFLRVGNEWKYNGKPKE